jgi:hypothetical protein
VFATKKEIWRYIQCFHHSFVVINGSLILFFLNRPQFGDNCIIMFLILRMCKNITIYKYVTVEIFNICLGIRYLHSNLYIEWHVLVCYIIGSGVTRVSGQTSSYIIGSGVTRVSGQTSSYIIGSGVTRVSGQTSPKSQQHIPTI